MSLIIIGSSYLVEFGVSTFGRSYKLPYDGITLLYNRHA